MLRILNEEEPVETVRCEECGKDFFRTSFLRTKGSAAIIAEDSIGERNIKSLGKIRTFCLLAIIVVVFFMPIEKHKYCSILCYLNVVTSHE